MHIETLYKVLQGDHEQEVRVATALKAARVAAAVKSLPYMKETIFPALSKMAKNTEGGQRIELAGVLMDMAKPLGKDAAIELVFPDVDILLVDEKVDVRLAVINRLGAFIETVGMGPSEKVGRLPVRRAWAPPALAVFPPPPPAPDVSSTSPFPLSPFPGAHREDLDRSRGRQELADPPLRDAPPTPSSPPSSARPNSTSSSPRTDGPHPVGFLRCPCAAPAPPTRPRAPLGRSAPVAPPPPLDAPRPPRYRYDGFALIRNDWAHVCAAIGERFGAEWLEEKVMPVLDDIAAQVARNESNTGSKAAPASGSATSVSELSLVLCAALSAFADQVTARPPRPPAASLPRPPPSPDASPLAPPPAHRLPPALAVQLPRFADSPHRRVQTRRQPRAQRQNRTYEVRRRRWSPPYPAPPPSPPRLPPPPTPSPSRPSCRCAGLLLSTKILTGQMINDLVKPAVEKCTGDDDMDVAHFAAVATERMQGALMG